MTTTATMPGAFGRPFGAIEAHDNRRRAVRAAEVGLCARYLRADWQGRAIQLLSQPDDQHEFRLIEEAFDDAPLNTDEIGQRFMLAALAGDESAIARMLETLRAHAASKATRFAEAGCE